MATKVQARFRSITDLCGYQDPEPPGFREPSQTDPSDYEPIERLVSRMIRGDIQVGPVGPYDGNLDSEEAVLEAMAHQSPTEREGFDLSDAHAILENGRKTMTGLQEAAAKRRKAKRKDEIAADVGAPGETNNPKGAPAGAASAREGGEGRGVQPREEISAQ